MAVGLPLPIGERVGVRGNRSIDGAAPLTITFPGAEPTSTAFEIAALDAALRPLRPHCAW